MQRRFRVRWLVNLALLIIVGLLIGIALLDKSDTVAPVKRLADYLPKDINEIRVLRTGKNDIHFKLIDGYWNMLAPYQTRAESSLIDQILSLSTLDISTVIDDENIDPATFGLQPPTMTIQLNQHRLNLGDSQAINNRRYIELNDKIMLIPDQNITQLKVGSVSYIDRHLIPQGTQLKNLHIAGNQVDLVKADNIASMWLDTKAGWISLAPAVQPGIDITLELDNNQTIHYIAEKRESDFVLINSQQMLEYHLRPGVASSLGLQPPEQEKALESPQNSKRTTQ